MKLIAVQSKLVRSFASKALAAHATSNSSPPAAFSCETILATIFLNP
eukprot:CAMPEP_0204252296 /NCGR_PEP_ID=MMETSP0468-20130131/1080_1 /ASSEMBLY_ACC=CAM_ASM_000383 /TAXON_ID=2969 /ORGANISM="Oxyrrhis marina" /LENGTH=46 /DNA_ID= /DNA_START= /DNA_END= /DNA_ORIENTATION=